MAATDKTRQCGYFAAVAAMMGMLPATAAAETAPERAQISYKTLQYQDSQPGLDRVKVDAHSFMLLAPFANDWSIKLTQTFDTVSGASPMYYSNNLTRFGDKRNAQDVSLTRYFSSGSVTVGGGQSRETDYVSNAFSASANINTEDKNTTFHFGIGLINDRIFPKFITGETKQVQEFLLGISQVLTQRDIVQVNLTASQGHGYYTDPYKFLDNRPREKKQNALLVRWNHHFDEIDGTLRLGYRYYTDSFGIRAHTTTAELHKELQDGWSVVPSLRLHTQTAADFFYQHFDPLLPLPTQTIISLDQRLSAFDGNTWGVKVVKQIGKDWAADIKYEHNTQQSRTWGIKPFYAKWIQFGLSRYF